MKALIKKYRNNQDQAPYKFDTLDEVEFTEEDYDKNIDEGMREAMLFRKLCKEKGYEFRFYSMCRKEGVEYEIIVYGDECISTGCEEPQEIGSASCRKHLINDY